MTTCVISLSDEDATLRLGANLANLCNKSIIIYLDGSLGTGKTTFSRGFLQALGYRGYVKSPSYMLVESYNLGSDMVYHFDLYYLNNPKQLEFIGIRDFFNKEVMYLVEWSQNGIGILPEPDLKLIFKYIENIRQVEIKSFSDKGINLLNNFFYDNKHILY
ncbi:tRNA (adenosine(37)-N6)-threonylcarbamoyltransferase complex ATPase subunit type 1 TsaE [Pantoea sp. Mhis]|uniref:tRNA (adenosine(37)-N6)-threonylcarbamoyltransferase complex ATPase subunit type 1 TsaE n=1 Tax=Pantoea sp. Mhis TaxID=2576759 RepID=UPI00135C8B6D|nr:tRNA (adenosine(37)-N6)-threonylcarbamoyltransferase complex ATPase subunit type 1 TsaE [Pantoea sp. Mhis]MXP56377.1 tRNA (adenosine(37)-N6)-threonylcarbamoyltransferase complex ATPase subunit type 1 TsaE [Pantoea sp. Mhis]